MPPFCMDSGIGLLDYLLKYHTVMVALFIHAHFIGDITNPLGGTHVCHFFLLLVLIFNWDSLMQS